MYLFIYLSDGLEIRGFTSLFVFLFFFREWGQHLSFSWSGIAELPLYPLITDLLVIDWQLFSLSVNFCYLINSSFVFIPIVIVQLLC